MRTIIVALLLIPLTVSAETLIGHGTKVRDGGTFVVSGVPIRLRGVAAPELRQMWGRASKQAMQRLVAGQRLTCELTGDRSYDR